MDGCVGEGVNGRVGGWVVKEWGVCSDLASEPGTWSKCFPSKGAREFLLFFFFLSNFHLVIQCQDYLRSICLPYSLAN